MSTELLKEVLISFSAKEREYFQEATATCTDEQRLAVAKRMSEESLPVVYQFTEAQIKRFVAREQVNWYRGISIDNGTGDTDSPVGDLQQLKERQYKAYLASGLSEAEARSMAGL